MRESKVERDICALAKRNGWFAFKWTGRRGVPDRIFIKPVRQIVFAEIKRPGASARKQQLKIHRILQLCGFPVYVWDSVEDASEILS